MNPEDLREELESEILALESIFTDELSIIESSPYHTFEIVIQGQSLKDKDTVVHCTLYFEHTDGYPEVCGPKWEIKNCEDFTLSQLDELNDVINQTITNSLGTIMCYTIITEVQEKLHAFAEAVDDAELLKEEEKKRLIAEEEKKKYIGTAVTIESFMKWKDQFDKELFELKSKKERELALAPKKITGKDMFLQNADLNSSDLAYLTEELGGEDFVEVDESLFEDLEDLEIEDGDSS